HITDLSWGRVTHPSEVVAIGQEIEVKVLDFEEERERISLGLKQLQNYPWDDVEAKYPEESVVRGRVVSITNYGAFVELVPGVEGMVHISEVRWSRVENLEDVLAVNETVTVRVLGVKDGNKPGTKKIELSIKQIQGDPWHTVSDRYNQGDMVQGNAVRCMKFGVFVELEPGIEGLVHISEMSYTRRIHNPEDVVRVGETITVLIKKIDPARRRIALS
ncbi:MAG: S1 RNA-binding domain-containing protein, partial [Planctomycetes bacterium]|nr:S1 RNA-binding domain-containing protein [Planctomycetota bacterium]